MIVKDPKNILIADDDLLLRLTMRETLEQAGHRVMSVMDGLNAIFELRKRDVDLLILDLEMPRMSGFEVLEAIQQSSVPGPKVLVITGAHSPSQVIGTVQGLGAKGILIKGFTPEELIFRVNSLLYPMENRTSSLRVPVSIAVAYSSGKRSGAGLFANLSEGGAFLRTREQLSAEVPIELKFNLPCARSMLRVKGTIRWSTAKLGENTSFSGYGILFSEMQDWAKEEIKKYVRQVHEEMQAQFHVFS